MKEKRDCIETQRRPFFSRCFVTIERSCSSRDRLALMRACTASEKRDPSASTQRGFDQQPRHTLLRSPGNFRDGPIHVEESVEVEQLIVQLRIGVLDERYGSAFRADLQPLHDARTHLGVHSSAASCDQAFLAVNRHHTSPIAARRLVADQPGLVELGDESSELDVELHGDGRERERRHTFVVAAEEAVFGQNTSLGRNSLGERSFRNS
jgi:hypothetical protein